MRECVKAIYRVALATAISGSLASRSGGAQTPAADEGPRLLPPPIAEAWLRERLPSVDDATIADYATTYARTLDDHQPRVREAFRRHKANTYFLVGTAREFHKEWRQAMDVLALVDESLWAALDRLPAVDPDVLAQVRLDREIEFFDLPILNALPETRIRLALLLDDAGVDVREHPEVARIMMEHRRRLVASLRHRVDVVPRAIDEFDRALEGYAVTDANRDQLTSGHIAEAINRSYVEGGQLLYRANARLAQVLRSDIDLVIKALTQPEQEAFESQVQGRLYPEIFGYPDPVLQLVNDKRLEGKPEVREVYATYRGQRRIVEARMVARLQQYRDEWLALFNAPMVQHPVAEFESDMAQHWKAIRQMEQTYLSILTSMIEETPLARYTGGSRREDQQLVSILSSLVRRRELVHADRGHDCPLRRRPAAGRSAR